MKKRIIASGMASVMALSAGASLIASADIADYKTQYVTKAELTKLLADPDITYLTEEGHINDYGSTSGARFNKAVDYANAVLADENSSNEEATAAYLMVKAAKDALVFHDARELADLIEPKRAMYIAGNYLNDLYEPKYKTDEYNDFEDAFTVADDLLNSDDLLAITDAYEDFQAKMNPTPMDTVSKTDIESAKKKYDAALALEFKHQPWIRGTVSGTGTGDYSGKGFAWGTLFQHIMNGNANITTQYNYFDKNYKTVSVTSNENIVKAVRAMELATAVLNGFKEATGNTGSQSTLNRLLGQYQGQLVYTYNAAKAESIIAQFKADMSYTTGSNYQVMVDGKLKDLDVAITGLTMTTDAATATGDGKERYWNITKSASKDYKPINSASAAGAIKLIGAELVIKNNTTSDIYYVVDTTTKAPNGEGQIVMNGSKMFFTTAPDVTGNNKTVKTLNAGRSLTLSDYINVTSTNIFDVVSEKISTSDCDADTVTLATKFGTQAITWFGDTTLDDAYKALKTGFEALTVGGTLSVNDSVLTSQSDYDKIEAAYNNFIDVYDGLKAFATKAKNGSITKADIALIDVDDVKSLNSKWAKDIADVSDAAGMPIQVAAATLTNNATLGSIIALLTTGATGVGNEQAFASWTATVSGAIDDVIDDLGFDLPGIANDIYSATSGYRANRANDYLDVPGEDYFKYSPADEAKGLRKYGDAYTFEAPYNPSSAASEPCAETSPSLIKAVRLLEEFNKVNGAGNWKDSDTGILSIDNLGKVTITSSTTDPTGAAWSLLYTYMKYALEDEFSAGANATYKLSQIRTLIADSYELTEKTINTAMFTYSHTQLTDMRNIANEWVKIASNKALLPAGTTYKDADTVITVNGVGRDSTKMYTDLKEKYDRLKAEYEGFGCDYGEIRDYMAKVAKDIDNGVVPAADSNKIKGLLNKVAEDFLKLDEINPIKSSVETEAFNADGSLNEFNRLLTKKTDIYLTSSKSTCNFSSKTGENPTHYAMVQSLKALQKAYDEATKAPETPVGPSFDVDGDGQELQLSDVTELLRIAVGSSTIAPDVNKHDFNSDGTVNVLDASWLLRKWAGLI